MSSRQERVGAIIDRELVMFLATENEGGPSACQGRPEAFRVMRAMAHAVHGEARLRSCLADLERAGESGRHGMIEKYARMDKRLPRLSAHPLIDEAADTETARLAQAAARFSHRVRPESRNDFRRYLAAERETLSDATLALMAEETRAAPAVGRNLVAERHDWLCRRMGYASASAKERGMAAGEERS